MKVTLAIASDIHGHYRDLEVPDSDILIFAGDCLTDRDQHEDLANFSIWAKNLPNFVKIFVPGNHDKVFQGNSLNQALYMLDSAGIHYLCDDYAYICGLNFYGMPWTPTFFNWAFMRPRQSEELSKVVNAIPEDTDILITHGPPYGIMDKGRDFDHVGCEILARKVQQLPKLKAHVFGHIHSGYGSLDPFHNVSVVDEDYDLVNPVTVLEIEV